MTNPPPEIARTDARHFRDVLGQFPTGVAVVTAIGSDGQPHGMAVGSFSSVSLDPPLVAFMPARSSSTYPRIAEAGSFCVNVLAADQEDTCRSFAASGADKFGGLDWRPAPSGAPIVDGSLAWMDCRIVEVHEAGDHYIVVGAVETLDHLQPGPPLVFFRGGYGGFVPSSLVAAPEHDIMEPIRLAGRARAVMEELARELDVEVQATAAVQGQFVLVGLADSPKGRYTRSRVGYRTPLVFPVGAVLTAWEDDDHQAAWLPDDPSRRDQAVATLERVRERGWSVALGDETYDELERLVGEGIRDGYPEAVESSVSKVISLLHPHHFDPVLDRDIPYDVRMLTAPVFGPDGRVAMALGLRGFPTRLDATETERLAERLVRAADDLTRRIGGRHP